MQIVQIEASIVQAEVSKPYVTAVDKRGLTITGCIVLRLTTDDGLVGIGESDPFVGFSTESPESVMQLIRRYLGPGVLGLDPTNIVALHHRMDAVAPGSPFAKAALDIAAYDLWGKALQAPVYRLLGGRLRDQIAMIWPIGSGSPQDTAQEALTKVEEGFQTLHIKLGAAHPDLDIARIDAVRSAVSPDIHIMVDVNQGWDRSTAISAIRRLEPYRLSIVEQPVPAWDIESMAKIQATVETPISADEPLNSIHQAMELIRRDAARVFSLKNGKCGGLFRTRQIASIAEAAGVQCFVNSMIEMGISVAASLHLAASLPNLVDHGHALMSHLRLKEDILTPDAFQYDGKAMVIPGDCHGLGVTIDEEKFERRTLDRFILTL